MERYKSSINVLMVSITVLIAVIFSVTSFKNYKQNTMGSIQVTGSATENFISDLIVWRGNYARNAETSKEAYAQLKEDAAAIKSYLSEKGVREDEIVFSSVNIYQKMRTESTYDPETGRTTYTDIFDGYNLTQNVTISSSEVDKIEEISRDITKLIDLGIELTSDSPEYYYTQLDDLKLDMIAAATENARKRAELIAENSGSKIGELLDSSLGVFQITAQNSSAEEYSYGGVFNTYSKAKTAAVTVKLKYGIAN